MKIAKTKGGLSSLCSTRDASNSSACGAYVSVCLLAAELPSARPHIMSHFLKAQIRLNLILVYQPKIMITLIIFISLYTTT